MIVNCCRCDKSLWRWREIENEVFCDDCFDIAMETPKVIDDEFGELA